MDDSAKGRLYMVVDRDLLTALGLNLNFSGQVIEENDGPFNGSASPMADLGTYEFKYLNTRKITPEESFINSYSK